MKVNKKLIRLLLVFVTLFTITTYVYAEEPQDQQISENTEEVVEEEPTKEYKVSVVDESHFLSYQQAQDLRDRMEILVSEGNVAFKSILYKRVKDFEEYANEYYTEKFNDEDGLLILYDYASKKLYIHTVGKFSEIITEEQKQEMLETAIDLKEQRKNYDAIDYIVSKSAEHLGLIEKEEIKEEYNGESIIIEDEATLFTPYQEEKLKETMKPITKYGTVILKTININYTTTEQYAEDYFYSKFKDGDSAIVFLIDMHKRKIYIYSDGTIHKYITNTKATIITDNIYKYASRKEYYQCATKAFEQIETILNGGKIAEPMRHISNGVIAIVLAFFVNFFIVLSVSKIKKASPSEILKNCDVAFEADNVSGVKTGTHSVYSPRSSSSGGGGHSGGGGGGGHSGGGGGHSF